MKNLNSIIIFFPIYLLAQLNCNAFLHQGDTLQYKACKLVENIVETYSQFSHEFQEKYDEALQICPNFDYAYREKSTAYLKSGDFLTQKKLIDKAVELNFGLNLGYRAWCRYQFFRYYKEAVQDIEKLDRLVKYDIDYSQMTIII